jgi:hypothetical protein
MPPEWKTLNPPWSDPVAAQNQRWPQWIPWVDAEEQW